MASDPLLSALFARLPEAGARFDPFDRQRWLSAFTACLDVVYGPQRPEAAPVPVVRRGPPQSAFTKVRCERCGLDVDPRGRRQHEAMHDREDAKVPPTDESPDSATPPPPLLAEPISRHAFDPDAARRRAAAAL